MESEVAVVGAGPAGLASAVALRRRGVACRVFERAPRLEEIGAGLLLSPNAVRVIRALDLLPPLLACSVPVPRWEILDVRGRCLCRLAPGVDAADLSLSTRRSDLQRVLMDALPAAAVQSGCELVALTPEKEGMALGWADGGTTRVRFVVAADGAASRVRRILCPRVGPRYQGYVGWRALVSGVPKGWESGRVTESWGRGRRFGIAPVGGGQCYWYATTNEAELESPSGVGGRRARLEAAFRSWHPPIPELITGTPEHSILRHPISDLGPPGACDWHPGVVLAGDAAHALTPNLGQGCAMALEDAWELSRLWADGWGPGELPGRFAARRRRRWQAVWAASRGIGRMIQWDSPLACAARDLALRMTPGAVASLGVRQLLDFHPYPPGVASAAE